MGKGYVGWTEGGPGEERLELGVSRSFGFLLWAKKLSNFKFLFDIVYIKVRSPTSRKFKATRDVTFLIWLAYRYIRPSTSSKGTKTHNSFVIAVARGENLV